MGSSNEQKKGKAILGKLVKKDKFAFIKRIISNTKVFSWKFKIFIFCENKELKLNY